MESIRLIPEVLRLNGPLTMAVHEFITTLNEPTLVLSHFEPGTVSVGKGIRADSLPEICRSGAVPFVFRKTGGELLYHAPTDVTYAFSGVPEDSAQNVTRAVLTVMSWLMDGFDALDIRTYSNLGTSLFVSSKDSFRKIAGSAVEKGFGKPYLIHGSVFYDSPDWGMLGKIYGQSSEELKKRVACVREIFEFPLEGVYSALKYGFCRNKKVKHESFSEEEWEKIKGLAVQYEMREGGHREWKPCALTWGDHRELLEYAPEKLKSRTIYDVTSTKAL